mmetsp:Transcript_22340/g.23013  ORF Transcript_22340/g.23013 Transcript_22340/m.23013 type:complete len:112 (-) Transcript_22340:200-535(-)
MKNINFNNQPTFTTSNFNQISSNQIQFTLETNIVSPFLFLELKGDNKLIQNPSGKGVNNVNAGWFNDNNFLALPQQKYVMTYTSFQPIESNVEDWKQKLQLRSLQNIKTTC